MQAETTLSPVPTTSQAPPAAPPALCLGAPLSFVAIYWAAGFVVGRLEKPYFYGFLYGMASATLLTLFFLGWWFTRRQVRLRQRFAGLLLVVAGVVGVTLVGHASVAGFGAVFTGVPMALTAWAVWMAVGKRLSLPPVGLGALALVGLTLAPLTLIRVDGLDADLRTEFRWRWSPTSEDLFREELAARPGDPAITASRPLATSPGDWVGFRGPEREGVLRGVKVTADWGATPPRHVWRQRVGPAWSSVIVVGDRLFTQEQRGENEAVVCYEAATGKQVWAHEDPARFWETVSGAGPRATPTFADGRLFTLGATGLLNCLDAATGKRHWSRDVTADAEAKPPQWGFSGSPLVVDGQVVVYAGGKAKKDLLAYRVRGGELAWGASVGQGSYASPQLVTLAGQPQVLILADRGLVSVDPSNGEQLWEHGLAMPGAPRAVQAHRLGDWGLVVGTMSGTGVARIDVARDGGGWKATERWVTADLKPEFPDFVVHDGHAYGFDGALFCCIELEGGTRKWKGGRYGRGQVLLLADQPALLVMTEKGEAIILATDPEKRRELGRFQAVEGKTWNHPVVAHGLMVVRNAEEMACYDLGRR